VEPFLKFRQHRAADHSKLGWALFEHAVEAAGTGDNNRFYYALKDMDRLEQREQVTAAYLAQYVLANYVKGMIGSHPSVADVNLFSQSVHARILSVANKSTVSHLENVLLAIFSIGDSDFFKSSDNMATTLVMAAAVIGIVPESPAEVLSKLKPAAIQSYNTRLASLWYPGQ
jgi:hypothetical protein